MLTVAQSDPCPRTLQTSLREEIARWLLLGDDRSERQLAMLAGVDPATLNRVKRGRERPSVAVLTALVDALGTSPGVVVELFRLAKAPLPAALAALVEA